MECCVLRSAAGVCSTSFQSPRASADFTAPQQKTKILLKSSATGRFSGTARSSPQAIADVRSFSRLHTSLTSLQKVGNVRMSATPTTDEPLSLTLPEEAVLSQHPLDPHKPNFSKLLPESMRPYPAFEGWFMRLWDPESNFSAAVIMATNYATDESQVTLLFTPAQEDVGKSNPSTIRSEEDGKYVLRTYAVSEISKDAAFTDVPHDSTNEDSKALHAEPVGFEWQAPGLGRIKTTADVTEIEVTINGYSLKACLTKNILWDADQSEKGPEGWARNLPIPTHWYVYSLGSRAEYEFHGPEGDLPRKGTGWGHQEKNWGLTFPSGHVWFQGFSSDNSAQLIGSAASFTIGESLKTPYLISLGYRSLAIHIDMRSNELGTVFKNISISPLTGEFSVEGVSASHTIKLKARANPQSLSEAILAPIGKIHWEPACRETYLAELEIEVFEHSIWGVAGGNKLVDKRAFKYAGLEFGEDLIMDALEKEAEKGKAEQIERSRAIDS